MLNLNSARIFSQVVAKGSFSGASKELGIPVATVSRRVSEMENDIGTLLIERTTRRLRLTEAGALLYEYVSRGVEEMDAGLLALSAQEKNVKGRLRLSLPPTFEPMWALLDDFSELFPNVEIDVFVSERRLDFIEDGIDIALRIGNVASQSAVARLLTTYRHMLVASPEFLKSNPIGTPEDLLATKTAAWSKKHQILEWQLGDKIINVAPFLHANDYSHMRFLALRHKCVTELPPFLAKPYLASGELVEVLPEHPFPTSEIHLVYPSRRSVSRITREFIDYCIDNLHI